MNKTDIVVVGASNLDIYATSSAALVEADSNPGHVYTTPGGVGRNIAENLARLGCRTQMLTALGQDSFAEAIIANASDAKLDLSAALRLPHFSTSVYVCINKPDGDIAVAVSAMDISQQITPEYLSDCSGVLDDAPLIVTETNLSRKTLHALWRQYRHKLCVDCVSTAKSVKLSPILDGLYCLKANRGEAATVTGLPVTTAKEAELAAEKLHSSGVRYVIITLGEDGALVSDGREAVSMPLMPGVTRNTSGCGDAFFAGAILALIKQPAAKQMLRNGLAMARLCAAADMPVLQTLDPHMLTETLQIYQGGSWQ